MTDELGRRLRLVLDSAKSMLDTEDDVLWRERVRRHLLDRWYWFADLGIAGRADLAEATVVVTSAPGRRGRSTTIDLSRTPLAGR